MTLKDIYAQGDVVLERVADATPNSALATDADGVVVIARGEVTGHRHAFYANAVMFRDDSLARDMPTELYIGHVKIGVGGAALRHEEHDTINLSEGTYRVRRQREFSAKEMRLVAD